MDLVEYGKPLVVITHGNRVKSVLTFVKNPNQDGYIDFIENFNKNNSLLPDKVKSPSFHSKLFFQRNVRGLDIISIIDIINLKKYIKKAYSIYGVFLGVVEDINIGNNIYTRKFGDYTFLIEDNNIVFSDKNISFYQ